LVSRISQRLRIKRQDVTPHGVAALWNAFQMGEDARGIDPNDSEKVKAVHENIAYYDGSCALSRAARK